LGQIASYALRSLLGVKLAAMRECGVRSELEILRPVTECTMQEEDLLRCLGVLLDNAMEAASQMEKGLVKIIILAEDSELLIAIANSCPQKPNLAAMNIPLYSTKGEGRGRGLSGYHRIVQRYPDCVSRTVWADGLLTQELRVGAVRGKETA
jgi:sensor histidine kinase regulating citrate/malate metabolism